MIWKLAWILFYGSYLIFKATLIFIFAVFVALLLLVVA